jgi:acetyl esterase/lipase
MADLNGAGSIFLGGLTYGVAGGRELLLDVLRPVERAAPPPPMVIYVHGGGWHEGDRGAAMHPWLNPFLVSHGYVTASVTYRLSGEARWPAPLDDVRTALRWLRGHAEELGADPTRIGLWGHSAGAHLAAMAALTASEDESVQAVALSACPADLRMRPLDSSDVVTWLFGPNPAPAALGAASPLSQVHAGAPPLLLAHGTHDSVVPFVNGERLREALEAAGVEHMWVPVEHADHDWADLPSSRGRGEAAGSFGSVALPFFSRYLTHHR